MGPSTETSGSPVATEQGTPNACKKHRLRWQSVMPVWIESIAVVVCAISAVLAAEGKGIDWFGVMVLAPVTAVGGGTVRDLHRMENRVPEKLNRKLTEENRQSIGKLLTDLGHNEWQTREKGTEELKALGFQAQSLLREALKTNADPEVRRRIERILSAIQ